MVGHCELISSRCHLIKESRMNFTFSLNVGIAKDEFNKIRHPWIIFVVNNYFVETHYFATFPVFLSGLIFLTR